MIQKQRVGVGILVLLAAAASLLAQAGSTKHFGSGQSVTGDQTRHWSGGAGGGGLSWQNNKPYDPDASTTWGTGTHDRITWQTSYGFVPAGASIRWTMAAQAIRLAPGRYRWTGGEVYGRYEYFSPFGVDDYCSNKISIAIRIDTNGDDVMDTEVRDTSNQLVEYDITDIWRATANQSEDSFFCDITQSTNWPTGGPEFDIPAGGTVYAMFGMHTRGSAVTGSSNKPQINTCQSGSAEHSKAHRISTEDFSSVPWDSAAFTSEVGCWPIDWRFETKNRILADFGSAGSPVMGPGSTEERFGIPIITSTFQDMYVILEGVTIPRGNALVVDLNDQGNGPGSDIPRISCGLDFSTATPSAGSDQLAFGPSASMQNVPLYFRTEAGSSYNLAFRIRGDTSVSDLFWSNQTMGQGAVNPRESSTLAARTSTTITASDPIFISSMANSKQYVQFQQTGNAYLITGWTSSTVVTVDGNPSSEPLGAAIDVFSAPDLTTFGHNAARTGSFGQAGVNGGGVVRHIKLTPASAGVTVNRIVVAYEPLIIFGDSNSSTATELMGTQLPGAFTYPRYAWMAWINGNFAYYTSINSSQTPGTERFEGLVPGLEASLCDMRGAIAVWSSYGINDINGAGETDRFWRSAGVVSAGSIFVRAATRWNQLTPLVICPPPHTAGTQWKSDAMLDINSGLAGSAAGGRAAFYDGTSLLLSDPETYLNPDGYHLLPAGASAISNAAAAAYESGSSSQ